MLIDRYPAEAVFARVPELENQTDPVLIKLDRLLEDDLLFQRVRADLVRRHRLTAVHGRHSTPTEVILRLLVVKHLYAWSDQETVERVAESLVLRWFCREYFRRVPAATTLLRWAQTIQAETLHQLNDRAAQLAAQARVTRARKLRVDGTVVETTIHHPTDSGLLGDGVRVLTRLIKRAKPLVGGALVSTRDAFRDRTRTMRRTRSTLHRLVRRKGEEVEAEQRQLYERLIQTTEQTLHQAQQVHQALVARLRRRREPAPEQAQAERLRKAVERFLPLVAQVIHQARTRVLAGGKVPAQDKVVSLFEPHTRILQRRKTGVATLVWPSRRPGRGGRRHRHALPHPSGGGERAAGTGGRRGAPSCRVWPPAGVGGRRSWVPRPTPGSQTSSGWSEAHGDSPCKGQRRRSAGRWNTAVRGSGAEAFGRASRGGFTACGGTMGSSAAWTTARWAWNAEWGGAFWRAPCGTSVRPAGSGRREEGEMAIRRNKYQLAWYQAAFLLLWCISQCKLVLASAAK